MAKHLFLLLFLLLYCTLSFSQDKSSSKKITATEVKLQTVLLPDCSHKSPDFKKYNDPAFYIPKENDPEKIIKVNFNIFQDKNGKDNFEANAIDSVRLKNIFNWFNGFYIDKHTPSDPIRGVTDLSKTFIRFELNGIYFYRDSLLTTSINGQQLLQKIKSADTSRMHEFNICFTSGKLGTAAGITTSMPDFRFGEDMCIIMMNVYGKGNDGGDYAKAGTLAHEMGHALDLIHTYIGGGASTHCAKDSTDTEYLEDVYGKWPGNCPHFVTDATHSWAFDVFSSPTDRRTNNLMGGFQTAAYLSPKQIGIMQRALSLKTIRRYVSNCPRSINDLSISNNETWDFDFRIYSGIVVESGAALTIKGRVSLPDSAKIIVKRKAKLIIDGGNITASCTEWRGIEFQKNKWWQIFAPSKKKRLVVKNGGSIEKNSHK